MMEAKVPTRRTATVASHVGLHAKPAGLIAALVRRMNRPVRLALAEDPDTTVDASSPLAIMTLGAAQGARVLVTSADSEMADLVVKLIETESYHLDDVKSTTPTAAP